jgi:hypothetical protein
MTMITDTTISVVLLVLSTYIYVYAKLTHAHLLNIDDVDPWFLVYTSP